jgi:hypothetical protein
MERCAGEIDLLPTQITDFRCAQAMPKRNEDHEPVAMALTIAACCLH